jgi:four helix bundle protein
MSTFRDLQAWQVGMDLAEAVYRLTSKLPDTERFGLTSQMRRAAVSVPSNIAEGQARQYSREFVQFLSTAKASLAELDTQLELVARLGFAAPSDIAETRQLLERGAQLIAGLLRSLRATSATATNGHRTTNNEQRTTTGRSPL